MSNIHKTAIIEDGAIIGDDVTIGAYSIIGSNVKIGNGTSVGAHTVIEGKTTIGEHNQIFSHAAIGTIPQDLKFDGEDVELIIGNNNKIREFTLFNPGTKGGGSITKIGDNNLFMGYTHVAHDVIVGNNCVFANVATLAGHVEIDDYVVVGGLTPVHQFCKIGSHAMIGGGSVLTQDIPPFCLAEGNRASLRGLNLNGLRRRFSDRADIDAIRKAYKAIFESGHPIGDVAQEIIQSSDNEHVLAFANFVLNTKRGIPFTRK
ncbi:acyl-ACP--UDP-N-acetylglucosamine O-acyltransferase [Candidatus Marinarcus aquaticus]|uniref:Acyl-[acyl-carrier-protein]--UDP-N-acetylglucosamine O-acyltransferase n=1 Tax=Candidatus Marinarcus aquaticus TaxID=2044504 RepID=A0A4Q0XRF6_9BACT|nr:acyl-ACP--UDP-N-acetylglucosamine O-acyltransferase [Candidatus Marinarcus aquaticus]RXJ55448.1 acyl-[acyl-carrier-protein]--UDP-N-acetylglucosamine O-acyltransferase [Candidatus Marinarcus aquaticus]